MSGHWIRRVVASVIVIFGAVVLSGTFMGAAQAHRGGARHNWNAHLRKHAQNDVATRRSVDLLTNRIAALESATPAPDDGDPAPTPVPTDPNDDDGLSGVIFGWADAGGLSSNALEGVGYALLGFLGALVTAFFYLNDFLPSVGGTAEYLEVREDVTALKQRREKIRAAREKYALETEGELAAQRLAELNRLDDDYTAGIGTNERWLRKERLRAYRSALPMYLILGSAFAVLFATNPLQGLLIGFGWTAVADRAGLKRQSADRQEKREEKIQTIEQVAIEEVVAARAEAHRARVDVLEATNRLEAERATTRLLLTAGTELAAGRVSPEDFNARVGSVAEETPGGTTAETGVAGAVVTPPPEVAGVAVQQIRQAARQARVL